MFLILAAAAALAPGSSFDDGRPPARFQGDATVVLEVTDQAGIERTCHALFGAPPPHLKTNACHTGERMVMPNPCLAPPEETYARMLCHELGHANGWASTHDEGSPVRAVRLDRRRPLEGGAKSGRPQK